MIIGNLKIEKHCVIGANDVITKNVLVYSLVVGNPVKGIKQYNIQSERWKNIKS